DIFGIIKLLGGAQLNLINTYWPLALLSFGGLAFKNGLYIFLMRQFFRGVPDELEEAAYVDGSGVFKTFIRIIVPLSVPMMITVFIFAFSWQWTDDFYTTMFFTKTSTYLMPNIVTVPASLGAAGFASANVYASAIINTCALMIILPLVIMYCFCQRYIVQGIERSGIVG
ncbi:MAG: carbohydrate ABC transporter permease, partial [Clostridia bacterium]|nr:carbohydrate ABC transporter permease [Clostridia bacterium]